MPSTKDLAMKVPLDPGVVETLARRMFEETKPEKRFVWEEQFRSVRDQWRRVACWHLQELLRRESETVPHGTKPSRYPVLSAAEAESQKHISPNPQ